MSTYAIGDIQGCIGPLQKLLDKIHFAPDKDKLWFTGDLVNRGPDSLMTLRFIKSLGDAHYTVLGNHDLHLLAVAKNVHQATKEDTLTSILKAHDRDELLDWLINRPLLHYDEKNQYLLVHAGLSPQWDLKLALQLAKEVETILAGERAHEFFANMYGNLPDRWSPDLTGWERLRYITNCFTRVRFCYPDGRLELSTKGTLASAAPDLVPWFKVPNQLSSQIKIIFGHWAALGGATDVPQFYAIDTGCVWGNALTAMRLEDGERFQVSCAL